MKKGFGSGFATGLLCAALAAGLGLTAMAVNRAIIIDDDAHITINGATFAPKNASGAKIPLFTHEDILYVPAEAFCNATGLPAGYDTASHTLSITLPVSGTPASASTAPVTPAAPGSNNYITAERAKEIALAHAGVAAADASFIKAELDWDDGRAEYEVEFYSKNTEYDYDIDALTGDIRSFDYDVEQFTIPQTTPSASSSSTITAEDAKKTALGRAPAGSTVTKCKLDHDDGRTIYEVELKNGRTEYECDIDAVTGQILSWKEDH